MKRIAVSQRVETDSALTRGERRDALSQEWTAFAAVCGFLPVPIPNDPDLAEALLEELRIDGVLLTGGNSLAPCGGDAPERDDTEERTIRYASAHELPVLGVCRGAQMLAFYYGAKPVPIEGHVRQTHTLDNGRTVNSFHNWGMLDLPSVLQITARSEDGVVEEFHHKSLRQYGLQWHPERYHPFRADDLQWVRKVLQL